MIIAAGSGEPMGIFTALIMNTTSLLYDSRMYIIQLLIRVVYYMYYYNSMLTNLTHNKIAAGSGEPMRIYTMDINLGALQVIGLAKQKINT